MIIKPILNQNSNCIDYLFSFVYCSNSIMAIVFIMSLDKLIKEEEDDCVFIPSFFIMNLYDCITLLNI